MRVDIWGLERPGTDGWSSWLWWVINNVVWTDSWLSIAGASCSLICVGAGEEWARKVYALRGLRGVERQVGLTRGTRWLAGSSAGHMVARKARQSRRPEPVQGSSSQPESARGVCGGSPQNRRVIGWATKLRPEAQRAETGSRRAEKLRCQRTRGRIAGLASCWRWISVNLEYLLYIGFDYDLQLTRHSGPGSRSLLP
jgi:hypothetical protein